MFEELQGVVSYVKPESSMSRGSMGAQERDSSMAMEEERSWRDPALFKCRSIAAQWLRDDFSAADIMVCIPCSFGPTFLFVL